MPSRLEEIMKGLKGNGKGPEERKVLDFEFDMRGNFITVSEDALEMTGYVLGDIDSLSVWDVVDENDHDLMLEKFAARREGEPIEPYEVTLLTKQGAKMRIKVHTEPVIVDGDIKKIKGRFIPLE